MERYARHIVYTRWAGPNARPGEPWRPHASFDTLAEAVRYVDSAERTNQPWETKVIDLEHIDHGDMLTAGVCADMVSRIRLVDRVRRGAA
jgi:hypothetical protein